MNELTKIIDTAAVTILTAVITALIGVGISYLQKAKEALVKKIGAQQYNADRMIALNIYHQVEQQFKGLSGVADEKSKEFDNLVSKLLPWLTPAEVEHYKESIVGEINSKIDKSTLLDQVENPYMEAEPVEEEPKEKPLTEYTQEELIKLIGDLRQQIPTV